MTGTALEKLFFTITLLDKVSGPSKGVCKSFRNMQDESKAAVRDIGKGVLGIGAAGAGLASFAGPAREFSKALKTVEALDAPASELASLGAASKRFAMQFGEDAVKVIEVGKEIQSALPNLAKGALAEFAYQGSLLAKASEADMVTIAKFQGTMYSIFEKDAKRIGEAKWVDQLSGKVAEALKIYKSSGEEMAAAFTNLGSTGEIAGISMDEQMAVLGSLQATMGGARAGTAYKAFLSRVGRANLMLKDGTKLNFTDAQGKMLPIVDILEKIKKATGDGNLSVADQTKLMQEFGEEGSRAIFNLLGKTDALRNDIDALNKIQDSAPALKMAKAMTDELAVLQSTWKVIRTTIGGGVLPAVNLVMKAIAGVLRGVNWLVETIPGLKYVIGGVIIAVVALSMAFSSLFVISGLGRLFRAWRGELRIVYAWCLKNSAATHSMTFAQRLNAIAQMFWQKAAARSILLSKLGAGAQWLWTAATQKGALAAALKTMWEKLMTLSQWKLTASTGASTAATVLNNGVLTMAALKTKFVVFWNGLMRASFIAVKLAVLAGMIPAFLAAGGVMLAYKAVALVVGIACSFLSGAFAAVAGAVWTFTAALLANPVTWIVLGIVALIGAIVLLVVYWDKVKAAFQVCADTIASGLSWAWDMLKSFGSWFANAIPAAFTAVVDFLKAHWWKALLIAITGPFGLAVVAIAHFRDDITSWAGNAWQAIRDAGTACWNGLTTGVIRLWNRIQAVGAWFRGLFSKTFNVVSGIAAGAFGFIGKHWKVLLAVITGPIDWITRLMIYFWDDITAAGAACWNGLVTGVTWLWNRIQAVGEWIRGLFNGIFGWIGNLFTGVTGWIDSGVQGFFNGWIARIESVIGWMTRLPFIGDKIQSGLDGMKINLAADNMQNQPVVSDVTAARKTDIAAGGVRNTANTTNNNFGGVSIYAPNGMSPGQLEEWALLQG